MNKRPCSSPALVLEDYIQEAMSQGMKLFRVIRGSQALPLFSIFLTIKMMLHHLQSLVVILGYSIKTRPSLAEYSRIPFPNKGILYLFSLGM